MNLLLLVLMKVPQEDRSVLQEDRSDPLRCIAYIVVA